MGLVEAVAIATTIASVLLAVRRSILQFPVGLLSTMLFASVFWQARLYSSAALQAFFVAVQVYGWWYWLRGTDGGKPRITSASVASVIALCAIAMLFALAIGSFLTAFTDARMAFLDSAIFGSSISAQFLLGRKKIENWIVWGAVDVVSIWVYASQELWLTTALYVGLLLNTFWGYREWRKEMVDYPPASSENAHDLSSKA